MPGWIRLLVRFVTAIWCRSVETVGVQHVPRGGVPLIVVANHENGLIDPLLIASRLPIAPRFLAKSTLWKNPVLKFLFMLGRVVPVHRKQDAAEGADMKKNAETFEIAGRVLAPSQLAYPGTDVAHERRPMCRPFGVGRGIEVLEVRGHRELDVHEEHVAAR